MDYKSGILKINLIKIKKIMSLTKIYSSELQEIYVDENKSLLKNIWLTTNISFDDMKKEMANAMDKFNEYNPKYMLTDNSLGQIVAPKVQEWVINFLFPTVVEKGVLKYAIILSDEIFSEVSVEQMFDEEKDIPNDEFQQLFFKEENQAIEWLSH